MDEATSALVVAVVTALLTALGAYLLAYRQAALELSNKIDEVTATQRLEAYKLLWALTGTLPVYPPPAKHITYDDLRKLNEKFRYWYFHIGGIYLTEEARDAYFDTQELVMKLSLEKTGNLVPCALKADCDYEIVRAQMSVLRTQLTEDLRSRLPPGSLTQRKNARRSNTTAHSPSQRMVPERGEAMKLWLEKQR